MRAALHLLRYLKGTSDLSHTASASQLADMFTKCLPGATHHVHLHKKLHCNGVSSSFSPRILTVYKGLVDSEITKVPQIFILPPKNRAKICETHFVFPVIDLQGIDEDPIKHKEIKWGFFQVINHGIPKSVLDKTLQGTRQFFEQDTEVKKQYYTRDTGKKVFYTSNLDLYKPSVPAAS
ncbi:hypothetical protein H5410_048510 [Solanum commersonii]|uniref:Non-haem dioxygenase N-terminal domain-containing protein n=1 Tax=Solanum commersonii TaxID=4109 RepID=A0A9J5XLA3_SOLCO|nr:hypothetical protein H5410_048510 [Solanum commersonii]